MKNRLILLLAFVALACGEKNQAMEIPLPAQKKAPTAISISQPDWAAPTEGGSFTLTITSPTLPGISTPPGWIGVTKGNFVDYKLTLTVKAEANGTYDARSAALTISASGVSSVDFKVTQAGKAVVPDPSLPSNSAVRRMKELGVGWNLGNQLDALEDGFSASDDKYGCSLRDKADARRWSFYLYWLEYVTKAARAYGFPAAIWDSGGKDKPGQEKHCYTNHGTGEFLSSGREPIETDVRAWTTEDPAYTLQSVYDKAPVF